MGDEYLEPPATDNKQKQESKKRRIPRWGKWMIGIPLAIIVALFAVFWYVEFYPRYIMFDIPENENIYWDSETKDTIHPSDQYDDWGGRIWVWGIMGHCWKGDNNEEISAFFDTFLEEEGWHRDDYGSEILWGYSLPRCGEDVLYGVNSLENITYYPNRPHDFSHACLNINKTDNGYDIVFSTVKASPLTDIFNQ